MAIVFFVAGKDQNVGIIKQRLLEIHSTGDDLIVLPFDHRENTSPGILIEGVTIGDNALILDHGGNIERLGFPTDQLPEYLCNGDKDDIKAKALAKKEILPTACEKCFYLSLDFSCPKCGHIPEIKPNVVAGTGELKKLVKNFEPSEKIRWYGMFKGYARSHGYKDGWAYHKYKEKFGVFPTKTKVTPAITPSPEALAYIKYLQIKKAKTPAPIMRECKYCHSDYLIKTEGKAQHAAGLTCGKCNRFQKWISQEQLGDYA